MVNAGHKFNGMIILHHYKIFFDIIANKSTEKKTEILLCVLYSSIFNKHTISSALSGLFALQIFSCTISDHKDNKANTFFSVFLVGQSYGFWLIQLWQSEEKNTFKLTFLAKYLPKNGDEEKNNSLMIANL